MTLDSFIYDVTNKGFQVKFMEWKQPEGKFWVSVERPGQFPGACPVSTGATLIDACVAAARHASVPGY